MTIMWSTENTLMLLLLITGGQLITGGTLFVTPGSYFQLNTTIPIELISCDFRSEETRQSNIKINALGKYNTTKYQITAVVTEPYYLQALQELFFMKITYPDVSEIHLTIANCSVDANYGICREEGSTIYLTFTFTTFFDVVFYFSGTPYNLTAFRRQEKCQLKIMDVSTLDEGMYTCKVVNYQTHINVSRLRFWNQTNDNIIYGQEGITCHITCTTVNGYDAGELSIQQNDTILAKSNSSIVTFSFIPKKNDSFTMYRCVGKDPALANFQVQLVINYAPVVEVKRRVNSFDCIAHGYPETYKFHKWEHQSEHGKHVRYLEGLKNGTLNLQKLPQQYQIGGKYVCSVSNSILGLNGNMIQNGFGSLSYIGAPQFAPESRSMQNGIIGEPLALTFLLYSNPIVETIWIEEDATSAYFIHDFRLSKKDLMYTGSAGKGNIGGYEVSFEKYISTYNSNYVYTIWAENRFGIDSYKFRVITVESPLCNIQTRRQLIASCSIVAGLLVYLIVSQVCFYKWMRKKRDTERNIPQHLAIHNYDEIGPIASQHVSTRTSNTDHQVLIQQIGFFHSRQAESSTTSVRRQISINDSTDESRRVPESLGNERQNYITDTSINTSSVSSDEHTMQCVGISNMCNDQTSASRDEDSIDNTLRPVQSRMHQDKNALNTNSSSTSSTSSDESIMDSNGDALRSVVVSDGYEHPYQIVMQVNRDLNEYTCIAEPEHIGGAKQLHKTDEPQGISRNQTSSSDVNEVDNTLRLNQGRIHQDEHSLKNNLSSTSSLSSNELRMYSNGAAFNRVMVSDGYENPYQIVMQVNQDPHEYTRITKPEQIVGTKQSHKTDEPQGIARNQTTSSDVNEVDNTLRLNQGRIHLDEHSLKNNISSTSSTSSDESRMDSDGATLNRVIVSDGYENPYQIVMQVNKDPHEYTSITQPEQIDDANQSHTTDELQGKIREYDNIRLQ